MRRKGDGAAAPYALCVFVPLIDLDETVGYTQFWLGTHVTPGLVGFGGAAELLGGTVEAMVEAGSAVVYDYRLMHRGRANRSRDVVRPVLQFVYHVTTYRESKNYGTESLFEAMDAEQQGSHLVGSL